MSKPADSDTWVHGFDATDLLIAASRYYTGRMTALAGSFAQQLAWAWPLLPEAARSIIRADLTEAFRLDDHTRERGSSFHHLGDDCDRREWEKVRAAWEAFDALGAKTEADALEPSRFRLSPGDCVYRKGDTTELRLLGPVVAEVVPEKPDDGRRDSIS